MAKVYPYRTKHPEAGPGHRDVYHDHDDCPDGQRIKPQDLESGKGGRPLCDACKKLGFRVFTNAQPSIRS